MCHCGYRLVKSHEMIYYDGFIMMLQQKFSAAILSLFGMHIKPQNRCRLYIHLSYVRRGVCMGSTLGVNRMFFTNEISWLLLNLFFFYHTLIAKLLMLMCLSIRTALFFASF